MRRSFLPLALGGLLAACGAGDRGPFAGGAPPPGLAERFYPPEGWAWGFVAPAHGPLQRYGVSAPAGAVRAHLLILPDQGELAETWFETARDLNRLGWAVWVLDGPGQGGSAREVSPRDLIHARDLAGGVEAVRAMAASVIPSDPPGRLVLLGQGVGAAEAVLATAGMKPRPAALILDSPRPPPAARGGPSLADLARGFGFDRARAPGGRPWSRNGADAFAAGATRDRWRGAVTLAWQRANPALRMGGPSLAWVGAVDRASGRAAAAAPTLQAPVLVAEGETARGCRAFPHCTALRFPGAGPALELERDGPRDAWLAAVNAFAAGQVARAGSPRVAPRPLHPPSPPIESPAPARSRPESRSDRSWRRKFRRTATRRACSTPSSTPPAATAPKSRFWRTRNATP